MPSLHHGQGDVVKCVDRMSDKYSVLSEANHQIHKFDLNEAREIAIFSLGWSLSEVKSRNKLPNKLRARGPHYVVVSGR